MAMYAAQYFMTIPDETDLQGERCSVAHHGWKNIILACMMIQTVDMLSRPKAVFCCSFFVRAFDGAGR